MLIGLAIFLLLQLTSIIIGCHFWKNMCTLARWIKYEEDLNAEKGQWGKPHVATLSFKALVNLRLCMEGGTLMLDVTVRDLPELLHRYRKCCPSSLSLKLS